MSRFKGRTVCLNAGREQVEMSVVLTLMRTNASIIEVNVSSSASAMSPLPRNREPVHLRERKSRCVRRLDERLPCMGLDRRSVTVDALARCVLLLMLRTRTAARCYFLSGGKGVEEESGGGRGSCSRFSNARDHSHSNNSHFQL